MKKIFTILTSLFLGVAFLLPQQAQAQVPEGISYQAILRDLNGNVIQSRLVGMQISVLQGSPTGTAVYVETQAPTTNANGLISLEIGSGTVQTGSFASIDWANGPHFIKAETDPIGGTNYSLTGTSQLLSVPYALHAKTAQTLASPIIDNDTLNEIQSLSVSVAGDTLYLQNGGFVIIPGISAANAPVQLATLTTSAVSSLTNISATSGGNITDAGGANITTRGVCYSINTNPTTADNITNDGNGTGSFTSNLSGLTASTTYYVRAYAINSAGTAYGNEVSFTTNAPQLATLTTSAVSSLTNISATSGGNITDAGGANITTRGVCYSINTNPTTADNITNDGNGTGSFTSNLSGLTASTTYYVRAYAINSAGTAYGNEVSFTTNAPPVQLATLTTSAVSSLTNISATSGGNITDAGGANITTRGVCYSINTNPTTADNITNDGNGTGSFTSNLSGLTASTTYYVRAYAINSAGTAYGNEVSFTTTACGGCIYSTGAGVTFNGYTYTSIVLGNGQEWMAENLRTTTYANGDPIPNVTVNTQWQNLTTGAWVHYRNDSQYENPYGKLYNWYTVDDPRNVCPTGWHVPTDAEYTLLTDYLGGGSVAGGKMKSTGTQYWSSPNSGATNESGFSGLPGGFRYYYGVFYTIGNYGSWWSSTEGNTGNAWTRNLVYNYGDVNRNDVNKVFGFSVRCLRD